MARWKSSTPLRVPGSMASGGLTYFTSSAIRPARTGSRPAFHSSRIRRTVSTLSTPAIVSAKQVLVQRAHQRDGPGPVVAGDQALEATQHDGWLAGVLARAGQVGRRGRLVGHGDPGRRQLAAGAVRAPAPVVERLES